MQENEPVRVLVTAPLGVGGVTNMMINIQSHLDRSKVNFDYLVFHDRKEALEDKVASMGSRKLIASVDHISVRPLRRLLRINEIRKVCKENKIQILHYNADSAADVTNILGAKLGGVKYVTIHSHNAGFGTAGKGVRMVSKLLQPFIPALCNNYWAVLIWQHDSYFQSQSLKQEIMQYCPMELNWRNTIIMKLCVKKCVQS